MASSLAAWNTPLHFVKKKFLLLAVILRAAGVRSRLYPRCLALTMRCYVFKSWYHIAHCPWVLYLNSRVTPGATRGNRTFFFDEYVVVREASLKFPRARWNQKKMRIFPWQLWRLKAIWGRVCTLQNWTKIIIPRATKNLSRSWFCVTNVNIQSKKCPETFE